MEVPPTRMCEMCLRRQFNYGEIGRIPPTRHIQRLPTCALSPVSQRLRWITSQRRRLLLAEFGDFPDSADLYPEDASSQINNSNPDVLVIVGIVLGAVGALVTFIAIYVPFENPEIQPLVLGIGPSLLGTGILFCLLRLLYCQNLLNTSCCVWIKQLRPLRNAIGPSDDLYINWSNYRPTGWIAEDPFVATSTVSSAVPKKSCLRKPKEDGEQEDAENTNNNVCNTTEELKEESSVSPTQDPKT